MCDHDWRAWTPKLAEYYAALLKAQSASGTRHLYDLRYCARYGLTSDLDAHGLDPERLFADDVIGISVEGVAPPSTDDEIVAPDEDEEVIATDEQSEADPDSESDRFSASFSQIQTLLRIARKQRGDTYNRETVLGFPLVGSRVGKRMICGPLLLWHCDIEHDARAGRVELRRREVTPTLNNVLLSKLSSDETAASQVSEEVTSLLLEDDFGLESIPDLLKILGGVYHGGRAVEKHDPEGSDHPPLPDFFRSLRDRTSTDPLLVSERFVLVNGPRSQAFLVTDLARIAAQPMPDGESVLEQFVGDLPDEGAPEYDALRLPFDDTGDGRDPLWFPMSSNESQRAVAQISTRSKVVTVQGPPGTGKSQTIANLVCHLVTRGHSVLVTSHQRKAMEVVANKLESFEQLALSVLKGDRASLQKLKAQLDGMTDATAEPDLEAIESAEKRLGEVDRELRRLARRYNELSRIEHLRYPEHARYADVREMDHLDPEDSPAEGAAAEVARDLGEWIDLHVKLGPAMQTLDGIYRPAGPGTTVAHMRIVADQLRRLLETAEGAGEPVTPAARALGDTLISSDDRPDPEADVTTALQHLQQKSERLDEAIGDLSKGGLGADSAARWAAGAGQVGQARIEDWTSRLKSINRDLDRRVDVPAAVDFGPGLRQVVGELRSAGTYLKTVEPGFFRWFLSREVRKARRTIADAGFPVRRATLGLDLQAVDDTLARLRALDALRALEAEFAERLPLSSPTSRTSSPDGAPGRVSTLRISLELLDEIASLPIDRLTALTGRSIDTAMLVVPETRARITSLLRDALRWIRRIQVTESLTDRIEVEGHWGDRVDAVVEAIRQGVADPASTEAAERLRRALDLYPHFERLIRLERGPLRRLSRSRAKIAAIIEETGSLPPWSTHLTEVLEAHRLGRLLRQDLKADPDDLADISDALRNGQRKRQDLIAALVDRKRHLAVTEAMSRPRTRARLLELKKLLSRKRLNNSLITLRDRIDYGEVLRAFPCWICTIDDAARIFPPRAGLFDFVIVDEASQCPQAVVLPLAYRAKRMIVVGDKKQLKPSTSRFLSNDVVALQQAHHGIDAHPKASFLNGRDSLLDLAEACSNATRMLDEHFRCDPAIIRWSNGRYYNNQLKIMTPQRPDRARVPVEIRELTDADENRDRKYNRVEAEAVVRFARELIDSGDASGKSIGILSLFRPQVELLRDLVAETFADDPALIDRHQIVVATADGFQGDERDIMLYSFRHGPSSHGSSITSIQREEERLNVAFTRARARAVCFVSLPVSSFPNGAVRDFLEHTVTEEKRARDWDEPGEQPDHFDSQFEEDVCHALRDRGLRVTTQVPCGRYLIDLVIEDEEGRQLAVECDGEWKHDELGQLRPEDYQRQDIIERAGWVVHRIPGRRWLLDPTNEVDGVLDAVGRQPTRAQVRDVLGLDEAVEHRPERTDGAQQPDTSSREPEPYPADSSAHATEPEPDEPDPRNPETAMSPETGGVSDKGEQDGGEARDDDPSGDEATERTGLDEAARPTRFLALTPVIERSAASGASTDLNGAPGEEATPDSEGSEDENGETDDAQDDLDLVFRLRRWIVLQPQPEWDVHDRLEPIHETLKAGLPLEGRQQAVLDKALSWAGTLGFRPGAAED